MVGRPGLQVDRRVTVQAYSGGDAPNLTPFTAMGGNTEEPLAAAIGLRVYKVGMSWPSLKKKLKEPSCQKKRATRLWAKQKNCAT